MRRDGYLKRKFLGVVQLGRVLLVDVVILLIAVLLLPCHGTGRLRLSSVVRYTFMGLATLMPSALESFRILDTRSGRRKSGGGDRG